MIDASTLDLKEKVVALNRVAKVVKGGRTFRFSALVVVGDEQGHVGVGNGKAAEVPDAIKKAIDDAKKNLIEVPVVDTTIPHEIIGHFGAASSAALPCWRPSSSLPRIPAPRIAVCPCASTVLPVARWWSSSVSSACTPMVLPSP